MADSSAPRVSGFNIELPVFNFFINVQDTHGNFLDDVTVRIEFGNEFIQGKADPFGNFFANVPPGVNCIIRISRDCYNYFEQRFLLVPVDTSKNLVFKVVDEADVPIDGAEVNIQSSIPSTLIGATGPDGLFSENINTDFINTVHIDKTDYHELIYTYNPFVPVDWLSSDYRIVPILTMISSINA